MATTAPDLAYALDGFPDRERLVLELRYGIHDGYGRTLGEVASIFNITPKQVREIENEALRTLRWLEPNLTL